MTFREYYSHQNIHAKHQYPVIGGFVVYWRPDSWPEQEEG